MRAIIVLLLTFYSSSAHAIKTASSFDLSYGITSLSLTTVEVNSRQVPLVRTLNSSSGFEVDYNVALFDYKTVATMSFMQYANSTLGQMSVSRVSMGVSYHFIRVNGQRILLDNGVEGKIWGISPAIEFTAGINKLSINDEKNPSFNFTAALIDFLPRVLIEIPMSSSFLLLIRGGYLFSMGNSSQLFNIKYSGSTINIGFRLTTL